MNKHEKRFLSRRTCYLCEARLDQNSCHSFVERCSDEVMAERRRNCLKTYKPRPEARKKKHPCRNA